MVCNKNGGICVFKRKSAKLKISHFSSYFTINIPSWVFIDLGFIKCDIFDTCDTKVIKRYLEIIIYSIFSLQKCIFFLNFTWGRGRTLVSDNI